MRLLAEGSSSLRETMTRFTYDASSRAFARYRAGRRSILLVLCLAACGDEGAGSDDGADAPDTEGGVAEIEFSGEQPFLPGFDFDSGWLPDGSPVAVRSTVTAGGGVTVTARAMTDGETLTPIAGTGALAVEGSLALEVSARIDTSGIMYEGIVDSFEYGIDPVNETFDPFALDATVMASSTLPAAVLGEVPIPSVPGATLVIEVTGGNIDTMFQGTCAEAQGGFGQFAGTLTMQGTVACAATVQIEIPIVGTESFGPFAFDVPIPPIETAIDLGTLSLATGEPAAAMGICDGAGTTSAEDTSASASDTSGDDVADTSGNDSDAGETGDPATTDPSTDDTDDPTTDGQPGDPDYPQPDENGCPAGHVGVGVNTEPDNAVCLPPCDGSGACPSGATGNAIGVCGFNPDTTYLGCTVDTDCSGGEFCQDGFCQFPPSHCVLLCEGGETCPDGMSCLIGACTYPL